MDGRAPALADDVGTTATLEDYRHEILAGLTAAQKRLSPKYLYDERGSELFDEICSLPEYYQTRTELSLLRAGGPDIAVIAGAEAEVVELGAGSSLKARLLLDSLERPARYLPVDISAAYLVQQAADVADAYPHVAVHPVFADFTRPFSLPVTLDPDRTLIFFPGSTIGNLSRAHAAALLKSLARHTPGGLLIGVDICKDREVLHAAYNDSRGVTAAFNINLLTRLNRELGASFDVDSFEHDAIYDEQNSRIEMRLVSTEDQTVRVADVPIEFRRGEYIVSEHSHKYAPDELSEVARAAGFSLLRRWVDADKRFSLSYFRVQ